MNSDTRHPAALSQGLRDLLTERCARSGIPEATVRSYLAGAFLPRALREAIDHCAHQCGLRLWDD